MCHENWIFVCSFRIWKPVSVNSLISNFTHHDNNVNIFSSYLYQIARLGDDDDEPEFSSKMPLDEGDTFFFAPRSLTNLVLVDECESLSPVMTCHVRIFVIQFRTKETGTFSRLEIWSTKTRASYTWLLEMDRDQL